MSDPNPAPKAPAGEGERVQEWPDLATRLQSDPDYQRAVRLLDEFGWSSNVSRDGRLMSKMYVVAEAVADAFAADRRAAEARADVAEEAVKALREGLTAEHMRIAEAAVKAEWRAMSAELRAPDQRWPVSPTNWRILKAGWDAIARTLLDAGLSALAEAQEKSR
jgi:hypothetical protein